MNIQTVRDEIAKIEAAIETADPALKAPIENATAAAKAGLDSIADNITAHVESAKATADAILGATAGPST
jgi:ABC-type Zn uptake system ZnuABC Zn-binding protein ZnuA